MTYFFNGGEETAVRGEGRELVPSPRDVPTYDYKPSMSAARPQGVRLRWRTASRRSASSTSPTPTWWQYGVIPAAVAAIETVDTCLGEVVEAVPAAGGACLITADYGNADHMLEPATAVPTRRTRSTRCR